MKRDHSEWRMKRHAYPSGKEVIQLYLVLDDDVLCRIESEDLSNFLASATWRNGTMRKPRTLRDAKAAALKLLRVKTVARLECIAREIAALAGAAT